VTAANPEGAPTPAPERRVLVEDPALEVLELRAGLEPELPVEQGAGVAVEIKRLGLPSGAVEREHQLTARTFPQRLLVDQLLELRPDPNLLPEREPGVDPVGRRLAALALKPPHRLLGELVVPEVRERGPPPEIERGREQPLRGRRVAELEGRASVACELLEPLAVELSGLQVERVASGGRLEPIRSEHPSQPGHVLLDVLGRILRSPFAPETVGQAVGGDRLVRVEQEDREKRALLPAADRDRFAPLEDFEQAQKAEVHGLTVTPLRNRRLPGDSPSFNRDQGPVHRRLAVSRAPQPAATTQEDDLE